MVKEDPKTCRLLVKVEGIAKPSLIILTWVSNKIMLLL